MSRRSPLRLLTAGVALLALLAGTSGCAAALDPNASSTDDASHKKVGVFVIAQAALLDSVVDAFEASVKDTLGDSVTVEFDEKNANGDQSLISSIARDFASSDDDAFAVIGTPAVIALAKVVTDRPIFALAMGDPVGAGVAKSLDAPGGNVTGSIDYIDPSAILADIQKIQPTLTRLGTVYDPSNQNMQVWVSALKTAAAAKNVQLVEATIAGSADVAQAARSLSGRVDAAIVGPDATVVAGIDAVGAAATAGAFPLYQSGGDATVAGVFATIGPDYPELGTSAGVSAAAILTGTATAATTPFTTPSSLQVSVNKTTRDALGLTVPASLNATVVGG